MLQDVVQRLLFEPQKVIETAVRSPDPTTYRRSVALSFQLLNMARFIPSISSTQTIKYESVLIDLQRAEQAKLESHFKNARSSVLARLKELRADFQNPVKLSSELRAAFLKPSFPDCLQSIHSLLKLRSAGDLLHELTEAQRHLDSVETIYTPEASRYPIFSEFCQLVRDSRKETASAIEEFEVLCTAEVETAELLRKLATLWQSNPRVLLDTKHKTIHGVQNGLSESDWAGVDDMEQRSLKPDSKAAMYADRHRKFMKNFQMNALNQMIDVGSHFIAEYCQEIPAWLERRRDLSDCSEDDAAMTRLMSGLDAGLKSYVSGVTEMVTREDFSGLSSVVAVISSLKTELFSKGFIQMREGNWEVESELLASFEKSISVLLDPTVLEVRNLFQLSCPSGNLNEAARTERFKLKSLMHYCTCFRAVDGLKDSPHFKQLMVKSSQNISSLILPSIDKCICSLDDRFSGTVAVKYLHFVNQCEEVFVGINKTLHIDYLMKKIKGSSRIAEISDSVLALKDHKDLGAAANHAIEIFPAFRRMNIQLYNQKAGQVKAQDVLNDLKIHLNPDQFLSSQQKQNLQRCFDAYQRSYDDVISELIASFGNPATRKDAKNRLLDKAKQQALASSETIKQRGLDLCKQCDDVGKMLGLLFVVWTILEIDEVDSSSDADFRETLLQPHATQIITILLMLGVDAAGASPNHLAEVKTGEGKSVTLGALSLMLALLGKSVNVVCYNPYLSTRDWMLFRKLFTFFGVSSCCVHAGDPLVLAPSACRITYCTIDDLVDLLMKTGSIPNLRQLVLHILSNRSSSAASIKLHQHDKVLLIDEVDVFFGHDFFGHCQHVGVVVPGPQSKELLEWMFLNREQLLKQPNVDFLMQQVAVKKLTDCYPGLLRHDILKDELRKMIKDLRDFPADFSVAPLHECYVSQEQQNVGYHDKRVADINYEECKGYKTFFAYLYYCSTPDRSKRIDIKANARSYGVQLRAGCVLYSELPKCFGAIHGLSGTVRYLGKNESRILDEYKFERRSYIPSTFQKSSLAVPLRLFVEESSVETNFFLNIREEISRKLDRHQTTLVVFDTYSELQSFKLYMEHHCIKNPDYRPPEALHDEMTHIQRDGVIVRSMGQHSITLMTKTFGRGTDFKCHNREVDSVGGVYVILTYLPQSLSEKVQIQGRTCRQDYKGSFREMFWAQDLQKEGYVSLVNGKIDLEGRSGESALEELLECKRMKREELQIEEMFQTLESNSKLWKKTCDLICASAHADLDTCFGILKEFQTPVQSNSAASTQCISLHTVFIIDESGSMAGSRWESLQQSFNAYIKHLSLNSSSSDIVSVIQFGSSARVVAEKVSVPEAQALSLSMKGGRTKFGPSLEEAGRLLENDSSAFDIVLVFMTDGDNEDGDAAVGLLHGIFDRFSARNPKFNAIGFTTQPQSLMNMVAAVQPHGTLYGADDAIQLQQCFVEIAEAMCMTHERVRTAPKTKTRF